MIAPRVIVLLLGLVVTAGCAEIEGYFKSIPPPPASVRPAPPSTPVARPAPPPASVRPEAPTPRLSPQVDADRETRLTDEVHTMIQGVERTLLSIDQQKLKVDQSETYQTIKSFLAQAKEAVTNKDFQQAKNLAQKAHVLSDELSSVVR